MQGTIPWRIILLQLQGLLAMVDTDYKFTYVDVGGYRVSCDSGIFAATDLRKAIEQRVIGMPAREPLPGCDRDVPYFIVGDAAFPLQEWLMKPYPHRGLSKRRMQL